MKVQDENARRSSMLVVCRKISSAVWKIFSTKVSQMMQIPSRFKVVENVKSKGKCRVIRPVLQETM